MGGMILKRGFLNPKRSFTQELYIILFVVIFCENNFDHEEQDNISFYFNYFLMPVDLVYS